MRSDPKYEVVEEQHADGKHPSVVTDAGERWYGKGYQEQERYHWFPTKRNHNLFIHYPKDPNCEVSKKTKNACNVSNNAKDARGRDSFQKHSET